MLRTRLHERPPEAWEDLCRRDPHATLFLHPRWMEAITAAYPRYRPLWLVAGDEGRTLGILPLVRYRRLGLDQYLSMPFGTHGGPVLDPEAGRLTVSALAKGWRRLTRGGRVLRFELTVFDPPPEMRAALAAPLGRDFQEFRTHIIDLSLGFDVLWSRRYHKNTRNCVRVAEKAGVTVAVERGPEAVEVLCRLHADQAAHWEGIQPHPREAVARVVEVMGDDARIYVARDRDGAPLTAALNLEHADREVHPWMSGSAPESRPVRAYHLLMSTAIREACERGRATWNFGGSGGNEKIEFFKSTFGAEAVPVLRIHRTAGWLKRLRRGPAWD